MFYLSQILTFLFMSFCLAFSYREKPSRRSHAPSLCLLISLSRGAKERHPKTKDTRMLKLCIRTPSLPLCRLWQAKHAQKLVWIIWTCWVSKTHPKRRHCKLLLLLVLPVDWAVRKVCLVLKIKALVAELYFYHFDCFSITVAQSVSFVLFLFRQRRALPAWPCSPAHHPPRRRGRCLRVHQTA